MSKINNWVFVSNYGKNKVVQRTYVFLFLLPFLVSALKQFELTEIIDAIPFSWHMFFYSALFFTIGNIIYTIFSPSIIKENDSFADFNLASKNWTHIREYGDELNIPFDEYAKETEQFMSTHSLEKLNEAAFEEFLNTVDQDKIDRFRFLYEYMGSQRVTTSPSSLSFGHVADNPELNFQAYKHYGQELDKDSLSNIKIAFWKIYEYAKCSNFFSRWLCLIFYLLGTILLVIVTFNSILVVFGSSTFQLMK